MIKLITHQQKIPQWIIDHRKRTAHLVAAHYDFEMTPVFKDEVTQYTGEYRLRQQESCKRYARRLGLKCKVCGVEITHKSASLLCKKHAAMKRWGSLD